MSSMPPTGAAAAPAGQPREIALRSGDQTVSGLLAEPAGDPRALIVALPGGGMTAGYFHAKTHPDLSLLALGRGLGYSVLALDRPGYGRFAANCPDGQTLQQQRDTVIGALGSFIESCPSGGGVVLVGHSLGLMVALCIAADPAGLRLLGLDGSGAVQHNASSAASPTRELYWGDPSLSPPNTFDPGMRPTAPVPPIEASETARWPELAPELAARVRVPYQFTVAEHEHWWRVADDDLAQYRAMFRASPRMTIHRQPGAGHNISLGWAARAYHLRVLAFADDCVFGASA